MSPLSELGPALALPVGMHAALFLVLGLFAHAGPYDEASRIIGSRLNVVRLTVQNQATLQAYFDHINGLLDYPEDAGSPRPKIILFHGNDDDALAFVKPDHPEFVFWSAQFLVTTSAGDIDRMVMAHERRHFSKFNRSLVDKRATEYDADLSLYRRLFRVGLRDPETKEPQAALVHFDTVMDWMKRREGAHDAYIDYRALGSLALAIFAKERLVRQFPQAPAGREVLAPVIEAARSYLKDHRRYLSTPFFEDRGFGGLGDWMRPSPVRGIVSRLNGDVLGALTDLDSRRSSITQSEMMSWGRELAQEMNATLDQALRKWRSDPEDVRQRTFGAVGTLPDDYFSRWTSLYNYAGLGDKAKYEFTLALGDVDETIRYLDKHKAEFDNYFTLYAISRLARHLDEADRIDLNPLALLLASAAIKRARSNVGETYEPLARLDERLGRHLLTEAAHPEFDRALTLFAKGLTWRGATVENLVSLFGALPFDHPAAEIARRLLPLLPSDDSFVCLRMAFAHGPQDFARLRQLGGKRPGGLMSILKTIKHRDRDLYAQVNLDQLWIDFLDGRREFSEPYVTGMDGTLRDLTDDFPYFADESQLKRFEVRLSQRPEVEAVAKAITRLVAADPARFIEAWRHEGLSPSSGVLVLTRWHEVFAERSAAEIAEVLDLVPKLLALDAASFEPLQTAIVERLLWLVEDGADAKAFEVASTVLRAAPTTSPAGQRLMNVVLARLKTDRTAAGRETLLDFLRHVSLLSFREMRDFITLYTDVVLDSPKVDLGVEIAAIKTKFDPATARMLLLRLAERTQARPGAKVNFTFTDADVFIDPDDPLKLLRLVMEGLSFDEGSTLLNELRRGVPLTPELVPKLQSALLAAGFPVAADDVQNELGEWNEDLGTSRQRALNQEWIRKHSSEIARRLEMGRSLRYVTDSAKQAAEVQDAAIRAKLADGTLKPRVRVRRSHRSAHAAEEFHVWYAVTAELSDKYIENLMDVLRSYVPLDDDLRLELQIRLANTKIAVRSADIEAYVRAQFRSLKPLQRAAVFQLLLDGNSNRLEHPSFRDAIFRRVLDRISDPVTRATFVDLWEAGLAALPKRLHTFVLAVILAESGSVGSPEQALVTMLSHMGPLEQKFGQALAFANIPESYRRALRKLWDGAQSLSWWEAWDLIAVQVGDIERAGYVLTRILNSGSTMAYLEITHLESGRRLVVPVYRDGVKRSVEVGAEELRTFARTLVAKNPARYGFLPLIVEDSVRTMEAELDPRHKERMTGLMAEAYRRAARTLGWTVGEDGRIATEGWHLSNLPFVDIDLGNGQVAHAQEMADGVPLSVLKDEDPALYKVLTDALLKLEHAVLGDSAAPVDKDRMPGQFIVSMATQTVFILDHGQARLLDPAARASFAEFTRRGFADDVPWMARVLEELTNLPPDLEALGTKVSDADPALKPLVFLNEVSASYLALPEGPARTRFFDLVHGVRAQLRLLQWDQSEGSGHLTAATRAEVLSTMSLAQAFKAAARLTQAPSVPSESLTEQIARMHHAMGQKPPRDTPIQQYLDRTESQVRDCNQMLRGGDIDG